MMNTKMYLPPDLFGQQSEQAKSYTCSSLQPVQKNQQEVKFTFNVAKCDKIFDKLLKNDNIKLTHTIPPLVKLKRRAYCKWHNSFSHATKDCIVFRRQIQSAIDEGQLSFQEMQVDTQPFPINIIELASKKILVWSEVTDKDKEKISSLVILARRIYHKEGLLRKLYTKRLIVPEAPGDRLNQAKVPSSSIADCSAPTCGRFGAHTDGPADSAGQSAYGQSKEGDARAKHM
jgi:hypothetical protein